MEKYNNHQVWKSITAGGLEVTHVFQYMTLMYATSESMVGSLIDGG